MPQPYSLPTNLLGTTPANNTGLLADGLSGWMNDVAQILNGDAATFINAKIAGAYGDGSTDDATAIQAAINSLGTAGGIVFFPPGVYKVGTQITVPSRVSIRGAGPRATEFISTFTTGAVFKVTHASASYENMFAQAFWQTFENFGIKDASSADTNLTVTGRSAVRHGIELTQCDQVQIRDVLIRDLKGYALKLTDLVRECLFNNVYVHNCGDSANSVAAVEINQSSTGDSDNINHFQSCRIMYPEWYALRVQGSSQNGPRQTRFTNCQIEGGGNGSGGTLGTPRAYDLVYLARVKDITFEGTTFSSPGTGKYCINADGESGTQPVILLNVHNCWIEGQSYGGGIRMNNVTNVHLDHSTFVTMAATQGDINIQAAAGAIWLGPGIQYHQGYTGSPTGHRRGKTGATNIDWENTDLSAQNVAVTGTRGKYRFRGDSDSDRWDLFGAQATLSTVKHHIFTAYNTDGSIPDPQVFRFGGQGDYNSVKALLWPTGVVLSNGSGAPSDSGLGLSNAARDGMLYLDTSTGIWWARVSGAWTPKGGQILARNTGSGSLNNSNVEGSLWSFSVPAGLLGANGGLQIHAELDYLNNGGASDTLTMVIKFGTTTLFKHSTSAMAAATTRRRIVLDLYLRNQGAANDQILGGVFNLGASVAVPTNGRGSMQTTAAIVAPIGGDSAEDSTAARTFDIRFQHSLANASTTLGMEQGHAVIV